MPSPAVSNAQGPRASRAWFSWVLLLFAAASTAWVVRFADELRAHADQRIAVLDELGRLETAATAQSAMVWKSLALARAQETQALARLRRDEQAGRGQLFAALDRLRELEAAGAAMNGRLGFAHDPARVDRLERLTANVARGVQEALRQLDLSAERLRPRLESWERDFDAFQALLAQVREQNAEIAQAASLSASQVTRSAAFATLLAAVLVVLRLSLLRARRGIELETERLRALEHSEARFRELVQHSNDLILVVEPGGELRYASPSAAGVRAAAEPAIGDEGAGPSPVQALLGLRPDELRATTDSVEVHLLDAQGLERTFELRARDLSDHPIVAGIVVNAHDVTGRKRLEDQLRHQALHDPLTDLPNRRRFQECFVALSNAARARASVLFVDLDGFKRVNDSYGHLAGDQLLSATASRIGTCLGPDDVLARQGGDEFLVLQSQDPEATAARILEVLRAPFETHGSEVFLSASIGFVEQLEGLAPEEAVQRADIAMYVAKQGGKARAVRFTEEMLDGAPAQLQLESDFRAALERHQFEVYYQPKVGFTSGRIESLEALVRWASPTRGFVGPDSFIPFAEESGLVCELGALVFEQACRDSLRWQDRGVVVAVNLSPVQFRNPGLVEEMAATLAVTGANPALIELEITESAVLGDLENTVRMMSELKALGLRLAIDDFGTGYSNLSHLKHFDVDVLKIDQAFVRGEPAGPQAEPREHLSDSRIVEAVIGMAKAFGLHVVAEGVESESQVQELRALGADLGQGFFFSKPVDREAIDALLAAEVPVRPRLAA